MEELSNSAFRLGREFAWQRRDLQTIYKYCYDNGVAILSVEAWVIKDVVDCTPNEPTEPKHNIDPKYDQRLPVLGRTQNQVVYGIFPFRDGSAGLWGWSSESPKVGQMWLDYANSTVENAKNAIERINLEDSVLPEYSKHVFYNISFKKNDKPL
jgi:hypothetical protein